MNFTTIADNDYDGIADADDPDDDNDGVLDTEDDFKDDPAASVDTDGDGQPDSWNEGYTEDDSTTGLVEDEDDDNDGVSDADEIEAGTDPLDDTDVPEETGDGDGGGGIGDYMWLIIIIIIVVAGAIVGFLFIGKKGSTVPVDDPDSEPIEEMPGDDVEEYEEEPEELEEEPEIDEVEPEVEEEVQ